MPLLLLLVLMVPHGGRYQLPLVNVDEVPAGSGPVDDGTGDGGLGDDILDPPEDDPALLNLPGEPGLGPTAEFRADSWLWWFAFHEEELVRLPERLAALPDHQPIDEATRLTRLLPVFLEASRHHDRDLRASAALALGRSALPAALPRLIELTRDDELFVRVQAMVSLGVSGQAGALERLLELTDEGRRSAEERLFAWAGLGLLGSPEAVALLAEALEPRALRRREHMVRQGIVHAAGVSGDPALAEPLAALVASRLGRDNAHLTALAACALGRLQRPERLPDLLALLEHDATQVRRSAAAALGRAGDLLDEAQQARLLTHERSEPDWSVRADLLRALGRTGSDAALEHLLRTLERGKAIAIPHALTGLGLSGRGEVVEPLIARLGEERVESRRAATAVALGLLGRAQAAAPLADLLATERGPLAQSATCLALGLLGDVPARARERLVELADTSHDPEVIRQAVAALGLLGERQALLELAAGLGDVRGTIDRAARVHALGRLPDAALIAPLVAVFEDEAEPRYVRRYALGALGGLADPRPVHPAQRLSAGADLSHDLELLFELYRLL